jgi:hypothetical protein
MIRRIDARISSIVGSWADWSVINKHLEERHRGAHEKRRANEFYGNDDPVVAPDHLVVASTPAGINGRFIRAFG